MSRHQQRHRPTAVERLGLLLGGGTLGAMIFAQVYFVVQFL